MLLAHMMLCCKQSHNSLWAPTALHLLNRRLRAAGGFPAQLGAAACGCCRPATLLLLLLLAVCCGRGPGRKRHLAGLAGKALHSACDARRQRP